MLIVDDEATILAALVRFFSRQGWIVSEASDGERALAILRSDAPKPDVIICDLRMPNVSGAEVHACVVAERPALAGRFVFSTGDVVSGETQEFLRQSGCAVMQKPFELKRLRDVADQIANRV
ncbi:MAG: response regulator [Gemmatimonadaceae bacterium]|nr:response regulator [Gemmatimonadaceae bacterium]